MNPLQKLHTAGQSFWLDNLSRDMLLSGELENRIQKQDARGVTSNPAIFNKSIANSSLYDEQIKELALKNEPKETIYEQLVVRDVQDACDLLLPVYGRSDGSDGFVSLEVSPHLARDTDGTIAEAQHLFNTVNRPNVMIKIPGTVEGLPAIQAMLQQGVNINVTLLFSIERYNAVVQTYIKALEDRLREGQPISKIASVASFFLSRIDVLVDQLLKHRTHKNEQTYERSALASFFGQAGIASARLSYKVLETWLVSNEWRALKKQGAQVQRLLWASTGTKNPDYSDVMYIEPLIGPFTVSTQPEETSDAFADHGKVHKNTITNDVEKARSVINQLQEIGIDLDVVTAQLENEGIQKFIDPYDELLSTIDRKRQQFIAEQNGLQHQKW